MSGPADNIFRLAEAGGAEDIFTAAWACLLKREPDIAQAVTDILVEPLRTETGSRWSPIEFERATRVVGITNHPNEYASTKRPDFRIECAGLHVLVEHKLDAFLHEGQLQSYLKMPHDVHTYLALVTPANQPVPPEALDHPRYLKPQDRNHFRWGDLYPAVKARPGWLAQDFVRYMEHLGLSPFTLRGAEDIFDATRDVKDFREALKTASLDVFARGSPECVVKSAPSGRGCEIRRPRADISLIYVVAERAPAWKSGAIGPALEIAVYERDVSEPNLPEATLRSALAGIQVQRNHIKPLAQGEGTARLCYLAPLAEVLQDTRADTALRIADVLRLVRDDLL